MDGCFVCLLGPIAFDIVGARNASQAMGFLLAMISIPLMMGPMIGGTLEIRLYTLDWQFSLLLAKYADTPRRGCTVYFASNRLIGQSTVCIINAS